MRNVGRHGLLQNAAGIVDEQIAVLIRNGAEHPNHAAMLGPPGQNGDGCTVRVQKQIRMYLIAEAGNGGSVNGNAVFEGPLQLVGHNGDIFRPALYITEGQSNEFDIFLLNILHDFLWRVFHIHTCFLRVVSFLASLNLLQFL